MDPRNNQLGSQPATYPNPAQSAGNTPVMEQNVPQMVNIPPQSIPSPSVTPHPQQASPRLPNNIKGLITACFTLGIAVVIGTILVAIGLATGVLTSSGGASMVSSLLIGVVYGNVRWIGLVLCVITFLSVLTAKKKQLISIKKPLIKIIASVIMIYLPYLIINVIISIARSQI